MGKTKVSSRLWSVQWGSLRIAQIRLVMRGVSNHEWQAMRYELLFRFYFRIFATVSQLLVASRAGFTNSPPIGWFRFSPFMFQNFSDEGKFCHFLCRLKWHFLFERRNQKFAGLEKLDAKTQALQSDSSPLFYWWNPMSIFDHTPKIDFENRVRCM